MYSVLLNIEGLTPQRFLLMNPTIYSVPVTKDNCSGTNPSDLLNFVQLPTQFHLADVGSCEASNVAAIRYDESTNSMVPVTQGSTHNASDASTCVSSPQFLSYNGCVTPSMVVPLSQLLPHIVNVTTSMVTSVPQRSANGGCDAVYTTVSKPQPSSCNDDFETSMTEPLPHLLPHNVNTAIVSATTNMTSSVLQHSDNGASDAMNSMVSMSQLSSFNDDFETSMTEPLPHLLPHNGSTAIVSAATSMMTSVPQYSANGACGAMDTMVSLPQTDDFETSMTEPLPRLLPHNNNTTTSTTVSVTQSSAYDTNDANYTMASFPQPSSCNDRFATGNTLPLSQLLPHNIRTVNHMTAPLSQSLHHGNTVTSTMAPANKTSDAANRIVPLHKPPSYCASVTNSKMPPSYQPLTHDNSHATSRTVASSQHSSCNTKVTNSSMATPRSVDTISESNANTLLSRYLSCNPKNINGANAPVSRCSTYSTSHAPYRRVPMSQPPSCNASVTNSNMEPVSLPSCLTVSALNNKIHSISKIPANGASVPVPTIATSNHIATTNSMVPGLQSSTYNASIKIGSNNISNLVTVKNVTGQNKQNNNLKENDYSRILKEKCATSNIRI